MLESRSTAGRAKLAIARALTSRLVSRGLIPFHRHRITNQGLVIDTHGEAFTPRIEAQLFWGLYERAEIRFAREFMARERVVVELGGSLGVNTAHLLSVMDRAGRLVCVEANPNLIQCLSATISDHRDNHDVEVVQCAISDTPVRLDVRSSLGSRISDEGVEVPTMSLRELLRSRGISGSSQMRV